MSSIFDLSSASGGKPKKPKKRVEATPPPTARQPASKTTQEETQKILEEIGLKNEALRVRLEELISKTGQDLKDLINYCENPSNFTTVQWNNRIEQRAELESKILGVSKEAAKMKREKKKASSTAKARKGKTLGSRRNWIDMR